MEVGEENACKSEGLDLGFTGDPSREGRPYISIFRREHVTRYLDQVIFCQNRVGRPNGPRDAAWSREFCEFRDTGQFGAQVRLCC